VAVV
jgi:hypothetical protein